jgi:hypothetical protein
VTSHEQGTALFGRRFLVAGAASVGALAVPSGVSAQPAAAAATYSLSVTNCSSQYRDFCLYQKPVDLGVPGAVSPVWMTQPARPAATVTSTWTAACGRGAGADGPSGAAAQRG